MKQSGSFCWCRIRIHGFHLRDQVHDFSSGFNVRSQASICSANLVDECLFEACEVAKFHYNSGGSIHQRAIICVLRAGQAVAIDGKQGRCSGAWGASWRGSCCKRANQRMGSAIGEVECKARICELGEGGEEGRKR